MMYRGGQRLGSRVQSSAPDTLTSSAGFIEGFAIFFIFMAYVSTGMEHERRDICLRFRIFELCASDRQSAASLSLDNGC